MTKEKLTKWQKDYRKLEADIEAATSAQETIKETLAKLERRKLEHDRAGVLLTDDQLWDRVYDDVLNGLCNDKKNMVLKVVHRFDDNYQPSRYYAARWYEKDGRYTLESLDLVQMAADYGEIKEKECA